MTSTPPAPIRIDSSDFELFDLEPRFAIDTAVLERRWRALQSEVHPDRFAAQGAAAQRLAMQWAVRVNEAYRRLKDPLLRATVLCEQHGAPIDAETNTAMPQGFLMQQMAWREALEEASTEAEVRELVDQVESHRASALGALAQALDTDHDDPAAAQQVRALMFVARFQADIEHRLEALGQ